MGMATLLNGLRELSPRRIHVLDLTFENEFKIFKLGCSNLTTHIKAFFTLIDNFD